MRTPLLTLLCGAALAGTGCRSLLPPSTAEELRAARQAASRPPPAGAEAEAARPEPNGAPVRHDGALGLRDAVNLALERNLPLRGAFLRRAEALGTVEEALGEALPGLELTGTAASDLADRGEDPDTASLSLQLTQPLWRSGIVAAGLRHARLNAARTEAAIRQQLQQTIARVTRLYLDVLLQQHLVTVYEEAVGSADRMLKTSRTRRAAGTVSDYEVLRAEVEVSTASADLLQARNTLRTSTLELLRTLGIAQDSQVTLTGVLDFQAEAYDVEQTVRAALEHRPDLIQAEADLRMAEAGIALVRGQYGPAADAYLRGTYANPDPNRPRDGGGGGGGDDWSVGATLRWTLFDGFARRGRLRQAASRAGQAANALLDAEEAVRVDVVKALLDLRHADELYQSQRKNLELAREALRMLESGFRMGRNTQIEVLDAQSALTAVMGRHYNAVHAHSVARLAVRHATGLLGPGTVLAIPPDYRLDTDPLTPVQP